ncbi:MAG: winged helix-turn-helix domain-containing protein [Candidatus Helarchaeota archaeon]
MTVIEKKIENIEEKLEQINSNFISLQDLILYMTSINETIIKADQQGKTLKEITNETNKKIKQFRNNIPPECTMSETCANKLNKTTIEVLQIFMEKGKSDAIKSIDMFINEAKRKCAQSAKFDNICDKACLNNMVHILNTLRDFMNKPMYPNFRYNLSSDLSSTEIGLEKYSVDEFYDLLAPLCNLARLRILRVLAKGRKGYSQLERECNIKNNLNFHLEKLIKKRYIIKENNHGKIEYSIHLNGLKALIFLNELKSQLN